VRRRAALGAALAAAAFLAPSAGGAQLGHDNGVPAPARPVAPGGWLAAGVPAVVRIEHPAPPLPISGIRGYAVSVDRGGEILPCAEPDLCTVAETDLSGGIDDDTISLGLLPEGASTVRAVAVSGSGVPSAVVESTTVRVDASPPAVRLSGLVGGWANHPVPLAATASDRLSGMDAAGPAGPFTAIVVDGGAATIAPGASVSATVRGDGAHLISFYARDAAGNVADGQAKAPPPETAIVPIDESPPRVSFPSAQDPSDPERIEATVLDLLSGADPTRGAIAVRPAGSVQPFERLPTAVSAGRLAARWDSDSYPPGSYEFRATAFDLAGNAGEGGRRLDGARMVLPNPIKEVARVESGLSTAGAGRRSKAAVPYGRGASFSGRLVSAGGEPLGGLPVTVVETFAQGSRTGRRASLVRSGADGTFLARLAPGPSRQVEAVFGGNRALTRAVGSAAALGVRTAVRLRASSSTAQVGGAPVLFRGRLARRGAAIPPEGRRVQLQFRLSGGAWSEFRTVQTNAGGRFRFPYAFSDDDSRGVHFQFRAYVPAQEGWPFDPGASRPVIVTGR
jgi:hypothetical protein